MVERPKVHPLKIAWAGGLYEAKGASLAKGYQLRMDSVDETLMKRFHEVIGCGVIGRMDRTYNKVGGSVAGYLYFRWMTNNMEDSHKALLTLSPFFGGRTLKEATAMIARVERSPIWLKRHPDSVRVMDGTVTGSFPGVKPLPTNET